MRVTKNGLYLEIIRISGDYLGPAAERFIDRQIQNHLQIEPSEISTKDLKSLINWIRVAVSLLTEDLSVVESYCKQLEDLTKDHRSRAN